MLHNFDTSQNSARPTCSICFKTEHPGGLKMAWYSLLHWGCKIIPMWKSMRGEETVTQRANHMSYHVTMSFHFSCRCSGRQAIVIWKKPAARSKQDRVPKRDRNCDWNSNIETALNCQTTLKWLWKGGQMKVKLRWHGPQTTLKQRSNDPQTALPQLLNGPQTTLKQRSNDPQTHWNNQLNQHILTIILSCAQTLSNQRWPGPGRTWSRPKMARRFGALKTLGLKRSKLLPGRSWLYWGASTPQKLSHTCLRPVRRA